MLMELDVDKEFYTDFARQTVIECLEHGSGKRLSGCNGSYVKMDERFGVKFSKTDNMEKNFQRQAKAALFGLGPKCFGYFTYTTKRGYTYGCYVTENAEIICDPNDSFSYEAPEGSTIYEDMEKLVKVMRKKTGFNFRDAHVGNIGFIDGRLVCIDFGHMSKDYSERD